jgi:AcrR family transcriptional regulator
MDDVARELGISKKTLYQHIKDKTELVEKVLQADIEERNVFLDNLLEKNLNAIDELFEINKHVNHILQKHNPSTFYDLKKYYPSLLNNLKCNRRERMYEIFLNNIIKGKKQNLFRKEINEQIIVKFYLDRMDNIGRSENFSNQEIISTEVFYELFIYHIHGIANPNGIKLLYEKLKELKTQI